MERRPQVTAWLTEDTHPALDAPMPARVDYACVIAAFLGVDHAPDPDEMRRLRALCRTIAIPPHLAEGVMASTGDSTEKVRERLYRLQGSPLALRLVRDMVILGYGHGRYGPEERRKVRALATLMIVGEHDVRQVEDEVARDLNDEDVGVAALPPEEDPPGAWAGVMRLYRRLVGTKVDA